MRGISHIGIAFKNLDEAIKVYAHALGAKPGQIQRSAEAGMETAMLSVGNVILELMKPIDSDGVIGKFIENRGEGIHHLCLEVDDIEKELSSLSAKGIKLIDKETRRGIEGGLPSYIPRQ